MKNQQSALMSLKKLKIAKLSTGNLRQIKGGDCLPTEPTWEAHAQSDFYCPTGRLP